MLRSILSVAVAMIALVPLTAARQAAAQPPAGNDTSISKAIAGMHRLDGLFPLDWDAKTGKLYLEIASFDKDFLMLDQLPYGLGSNDLGLDRGQLGHGR